MIKSEIDIVTLHNLNSNRVDQMNDQISDQMGGKQWYLEGEKENGYISVNCHWYGSRHLQIH